MSCCDLTEIPLCPDPVFVIGSPRSATTALAWALAEHSWLWTSPESQVLVDLFANGELDRNYRRPTTRPGYSWLRHQGIGRDEFLAYVGLGFNALFTSRSDGKRWVDHTPRHTLMVDDLVGLFPGAQFVHILRDGRNVVASMLHKAFIPPGPRLMRIRHASRMWRGHVEAALTAAVRHPARCQTVKYERLVADPDRGFAAILDHLRLPHEPTPARLFRDGGLRNSSFGRSRQAGDAPQLPTVPRWTNWARDERRVFAAEAGDLLVRCGYATTGEMDAWRW